VSEKELINLLTIAKEAALLAGKFLLEGSASSRQVNKDLIHDVKIEADVQSEQIILNYLKKHSDFSILSEEAGDICGNDQEYCWIIDPVDGSVNYSRSLPLCCVSIGLWKGEQPLLGAIYDFNRNEMFSGIVGQGAWINDRPVEVSTVDIKQKAVLVTGFPNQTDFSSDSINSFVENIQSYRKVRLLGSAALSVAYVAAGRTDAYYEKNIMLWDIAGGIPIVLGAGGKIHVEKTTKPHCLNVCVTNGYIDPINGIVYAEF